MTLFEKTTNAFKNKEFVTFEDIHHEDFMFVREFSMSSREEHLANIKEWLADDTDTWHLRVQCIHEDDHVLVMRSSKVDGDGSEVISNNVSIKKDGLYWRTIVNDE
tara:strand:+ start:661 stop:978 length:318 start_codon:yes stop_codon:yes gene_type:complete